MMSSNSFCTCGTIIDNDSNYCVECGRKILRVGDKVFIKEPFIEVKERYGVIEKVWTQPWFKGKTKYLVRYGIKRQYTNSFSFEELEILGG